MVVGIVGSNAGVGVSSQQLVWGAVAAVMGGGALCLVLQVAFVVLDEGGAWGLVLVQGGISVLVQACCVILAAAPVLDIDAPTLFTARLAASNLDGRCSSCSWASACSVVPISLAGWFEASSVSWATACIG